VLAGDEETFEHFCLHGWMRVRAAFTCRKGVAGAW
jgi:hypothetical protein